MKRHITELEKRLVDRGFTLSYKTYKGKDSKRTEHYVYVGTIENYGVMVFLDYKREKLDHYVIQNKLPPVISRENLDTLEIVYNEMFDLLYEDNTREIVEMDDSEVNE